LITKEELLQGRDEMFKDEYTEQISDNLDELLVRINKIRAAYGKPMRCSSGWRPASINGMVKGASQNSNHIIGAAVDISDGSGDLMRWCLANLKIIADAGLYMEDFRYTPTWVHFSYIKPKSGKRIFIPSAALPPAPNRWNGAYDKAYDK
jgi:hypothetical protein